MPSPFPPLQVVSVLQTIKTNQGALQPRGATARHMRMLARSRLYIYNLLMDISSS